MFKKLLTAMLTVIVGIAIFVAVNGHRLFAAHNMSMGTMQSASKGDRAMSGMNHANMGMTTDAKENDGEGTQPSRVSRQSDVEKAAEAQRVNKMIAERNKDHNAQGMVAGAHNHAGMTGSGEMNLGGGADGAESTHAKMHAQKVDVTGMEPVPDLEISVVRDPHGGWNLTVKPINFRFAPEHVNGKHQHGEGHAHLYVNDKKVARLYGTDFHIPALRSGNNVLRVSLNTNDHQTYSLGEAPIERVVSITER